MATIFEGAQILLARLYLAVAGVDWVVGGGLPRYYGYNIAEHCTIGADLAFVIINQSINVQEITKASSVNQHRLAFSHPRSVQ